MQSCENHLMSPCETITAAYAAFSRNDPSVLFAAMDPAITWNEAEGFPLADRNPYVGPQAGGGSLDAQFCHVYRFRDGKVATFQQYTDTAQWTRLMG